MLASLALQRSRAYRDGQVITASELSDLANVSKASSHDNRLVTVLLVVIENGLDALHSGVLLGRKVLLMGGLVPVEYSSYERRDQECTSLGGGDSLRK